MGSIFFSPANLSFPFSHDLNNGVKGRAGVVIRVEHKSITSSYDSATTFAGGSIPNTSGQKLLQKQLPPTFDF